MSVNCFNANGVESSLLITKVHLLSYVALNLNSPRKSAICTCRVDIEFDIMACFAEVSFDAPTENVATIMVRNGRNVAAKSSFKLILLTFLILKEWNLYLSVAKSQITANAESIKSKFAVVQDIRLPSFSSLRCILTCLRLTNCLDV